MSGVPSCGAGRLVQALLAVALAIVTVGTLLPWPLQVPMVPAALYTSSHGHAPNAYVIRVWGAPLGTILVALAALPVAVSLGEAGRRRSVFIFCTGSAGIGILVASASHGANEPGPWLSVGGAALQLLALSYALTHEEERG